jgi:hypothetical protein
MWLALLLHPIDPGGARRGRGKNEAEMQSVGEGAEPREGAGCGVRGRGSHSSWKSWW